jgi:hypothetical protein
MPNRILREGILTSERIEQLNWAEEVFYRRLMSVVDDFGRYYARPSLILAACYPLLLKKVSDSDIEKWLSACENAALVRVYPASDGKRYLQLLDFKQQVRAAASKYLGPLIECASDATQPPITSAAPAHLGVSVSVSEDVVKRATRLPTDFEPTPEPEAEQGIDRRIELANFRDYWTAKAGKDGAKLDWQATWRQWARKSRRNPADVRSMTVPSSNEPDPALAKLDRDALITKPPSIETLARIAGLRRGAH